MEDTPVITSIKTKWQLVKTDITGRIVAVPFSLLIRKGLLTLFFHGFMIHAHLNFSE